jgi:heme-degrading monooxygenase HmoA
MYTFCGNPELKRSCPLKNLIPSKEGDMAIGVLIKRVTKHGENAKILLPHIIELRALAVRQPGYISGETFFSLDRSDECLVIGRWTTIEHWQKWHRDPRRIELNENMEKHLGVKTEYHIYGIGLW